MLRRCNRDTTVFSFPLPSPSFSFLFLSLRVTRRGRERRELNKTDVFTGSFTFRTLILSVGVVEAGNNQRPHF